MPEKESSRCPPLQNTNTMTSKHHPHPPLSPPSPRAQSLILMSLAMSLHFGGYEFARSSTIALFTSSGPAGLSDSPSAYPMAMGMVTPLILGLLWWYGRMLEGSGGYGPRLALRRMYRLVIGVFGLGWGWFVLFGRMLESSSSSSSSSSPSWSSIVVLRYCTKAIVACLFLFQNSYGHLLYSQHWSFLGSVATPTEGSTWFTSIAGLSSVVCTLTASSVRAIVESGREGEGAGYNYGVLTKLLFFAVVTVSLSAFCADWAYCLAHRHGFDPSPEKEKEKEEEEEERPSSQSRPSHTNTTTTNTDTDTTNSNNQSKHNHQHQKQHKSSILTKTTHLFQTSPLLTTLFLETISFQSLSTTLDLQFIRQLKTSYPTDDGRRASATGKFYGWVNAATALLQFGVLPMVKGRMVMEPRVIFRVLPCLVVPFVVWVGFLGPSSASSSSSDDDDDDGRIINEELYAAGMAFFVLKTLDYGIRHVSHEMVYQPLDFNARYLGKEVIGVFANRVGKSGMSLVLSGLTSSTGMVALLGSSHYGSGGGGGGDDDGDGKEGRMLKRLAMVVAMVWSVCSLVLSRYVVSNRRAEERVREREWERRKEEEGEEAERDEDTTVTATDEDDDLSNDVAGGGGDGCRECTVTTAMTTAAATNRKKID